MSLSLILEYCPLLEVLLKRFIQQGAIRKYFKNRILSGDTPPVVTDASKDKLKSEFLCYLDKIDIHTGDILILHSSMNEISKIGIDAIFLIKYFIKRLGDDGTLVIPAFPQYPEGINERLIYDKSKTLCWTGLLPNIFLRYPDVVRSEFPFNSLAAVGKYAHEMMRDNLIDHTAFGPHSSWEYCAKHHAKVLFLGTPAFHTTTISHIPEDLMGEKWPIKDFHYKQKFILVDEIGQKDYTAYLRKPMWANYLKSHQRTKWLRDKKLLIEDKCNGIYVGFIKDAGAVVEFLTEKALNNKTMYYVPRQYRK